MWLAAHLSARDPVRPGVGGVVGETASFPWCVWRREACTTQRGHRRQRGDTRPPRLWGQAVEAPGVAKSGCQGWDLASGRLGPSLHSGLSYTKKRALGRGSGTTAPLLGWALAEEF